MESLVVFAKKPALGCVKTRLVPRVGEAGALLLYTAFLRDTLATCTSWRAQSVAADPNRRLVLYVTPDDDNPIFAECVRESGARLCVQPEGDLGVRLETIFEQEFSRGARAVCAVGTDSPTLPQHLLEHAFRALCWERVALGPTFDGGYWLVGAQRPAPDLFRGIPWSTQDVMPATVGRLAHEGIVPALLPFWYDIDDEAGLRHLQWHLPTLDPQGALGRHTRAALQELGLHERSPEARAPEARVPEERAAEDRAAEERAAEATT